jgi:cyclase
VKKIRLIARMDIKGPHLIKGINLEGLRVLGDPKNFAKLYYQNGIDEIVFMDSVASLYGRNQLDKIIKDITSEIFIPITVGGGIRNINDFSKILRSGADKIAINSAAVENPLLISEASSEFGAQCVVSSIEAKKKTNNSWEIFINNGRDSTGIDAVYWAKKCEELGAGELFVTSVDREGTRKGFDVDLVQSISSSVNLPVIASGGMGKIDHLEDLLKNTNVDGVAVADALHYKRLTVEELRYGCVSNGRVIRN